MRESLELMTPWAILLLKVTGPSFKVVPRRVCTGEQPVGTLTSRVVPIEAAVEQRWEEAFNLVPDTPFS